MKRVRASSRLVVTGTLGEDQDQHTASVVVYDTLGNTRTVQFTFARQTGTRIWLWYVRVDGDVVATYNSSGNSPIAFGPDGKVDGYSAQQIAFVNPGPAESSVITVSFTAISLQPGTRSELIWEQNGYPTGVLTAVTPVPAEQVRLDFSNGISETIPTSQCPP